MFTLYDEKHHFRLPTLIFITRILYLFIYLFITELVRVVHRKKEKSN